MSPAPQTGNKPATLIVHGANFMGEKIAELLSTQKSSILLIDEFSRKNRDSIKRLKKERGVLAYDTSAIPSLSKDIKRIDYVLILLDQFLTQNQSLSSKKFLSETNIVDSVLKLALEHNAKVILTTSIELHRQIVQTATTKDSKLSDVSKQRPYTPMELQRYCENLSAEYHDQSGLNIRIARLGEVIGEGMPLESDSTFVQMLKEAITKPRITIPGEGLDYTYYVYYLDAVYGIIKALFSNKTSGEVFSLSYQEEISTLNLAYKILEINPKASEITFAEAEEDSIPHQTYVPAQNLSKLGWQPKVSFEKALIEATQYFHDQYNVTWKDKPVGKTAEDAQKKEAAKKKRVHRADRVTPLGKAIYAITGPFDSFINWVKARVSGAGSIKLTPVVILRYFLYIAILVILYIGVIAPTFQIAVGGSMAYYFGRKGYNEALALETESAQKSMKSSHKYASIMNTGWNNLRWVTVIPGTKDFYYETAKITSSIEHLTNGAQYLLKGIDPYAEYFKNFEPITSFDGSAGGGSREYLNELEAMEEGVAYIDLASVEISLAAESLSDLDTTEYPTALKNSLDKLKNTTEEAQQTTTTMTSFARHLPELLGKDGRKTYAIVFQNPMELRSTGGWLTSVAIVGIENGQVREMEVKDVYTIDGQITEPVTPPESMQEALDVNNWTLSLSNWSPDYPQAAESAEYFLELSGETIATDGVIAIDLEFVRQLIDVWGEIQVPGETEPVTSDNLYDKVIEIHRGFTPGSTEKPVFLSNLANEIVKKTLSSPRESWPQIAENFKQGLDEKHILVYLHNSQLQTVLETNSWAGHLSQKQNWVYPVEWNWGTNKANHFLSRETALKANIINENTVQQELEISYRNASTQNKYPEGDYVNYMRIYLPDGAHVTKVEGLDQTSVDHDSGTNAEVLAGWITIPINATGKVKVSYRLNRDDTDNFPIILGPGDKVTYTANIIKQPGTDQDPLTVEVSYPEGWAPTDLSNVQREINNLIQRTDLSTDKEFTLTWER